MNTVIVANQTPSDAEKLISDLRSDAAAMLARADALEDAMLGAALRVDSSNIRADRGYVFRQIEPTGYSRVYLMEGDPHGCVNRAVEDVWQGDDFSYKYLGKYSVLRRERQHNIAVLVTEDGADQ
ncbi:hypothetical protein B7R21_09895 [Subtercola boreus]|uniref:Uncharacterized protein n=1 Tax=Subtercola boreus TaxID=120213 RepID=A0A3E0VTB9_9MICO|nr:hypothetical protein [Subtercola boreus]RFA12648.1 hypothetical protein B7R21_09895 [Subtercola boreus]